MSDQSKWPIWARKLKYFARPEDTGIGDVLVRMIGDYNSEAFKIWFQNTFGKSCGCAERQERLNIEYPLP